MGMSESIPSFLYLTHLSHSFDVHQGSPDHLQGGQKLWQVLWCWQSSQTSRQGNWHFWRPYQGLGPRPFPIWQHAQPSKACSGCQISTTHGERCADLSCFPPPSLPVLMSPHDKVSLHWQIPKPIKVECWPLSQGQRKGECTRLTVHACAMAHFQMASTNHSISLKTTPPCLAGSRAWRSSFGSTVCGQREEIC